jgi:hypothetical protein
MPPSQNSIRTSGGLIQRSKFRQLLSRLADVEIEPSAGLVRIALELKGADHVRVALELEVHLRSEELLITRPSQEQMPLRGYSMKLRRRLFQGAAQSVFFPQAKLIQSAGERNPSAAVLG